jgi:hypothetical protein
LCPRRCLELSLLPWQSGVASFNYTSCYCDCRPEGYLQFRAFTKPWINLISNIGNRLFDYNTLHCFTEPFAKQYFRNTFVTTLSGRFLPYTV